MYQLFGLGIVYLLAQPQTQCNYKALLVFFLLLSGETGAALSRPQRPLSARTAHHAPAPMKGYHVSRSMSQHSSGGGGGGPCHCTPDDCDGPGRDYYHGRSDGHYYSGGPNEALALERHHSHSHAHSHSHSHSHSGTFPRSHPSQHPPLQSFDSCEECLSSGHGGKMHRIPPNLMDQFEKQVPFHPDGFHTLQYQRTASGGAEQRSESPSRIRHLVNSVQRLFAKSHSLEAPTKREYNGMRGGGEYRGDRGGGHRSGGEEVHYSGHQSRSTRRSKSRERSKSGDSRHESGRRHRSRTAGWWSSDDNLDSDSSFLVSGGRRGYPTGHESLDAAIQELTMKKPKERSGGPGSAECMACTTMALTGGEGGGHHGHHGHSLKRSTWSAMTVSQAREVYPSTRGGGYDKALVPLENKLKERSFHYLQVPSEDWGGGGYGGSADSGGEIPCRRMRSGSYIKAMGDDDSADSETSPKASPKSTLIAQRDAFRRSISMDQRLNATRTAYMSPLIESPRLPPPFYTRSLTSSQLGDTLNHQFETVCETMFGEVESQAVEALDLPGVFRTRSHSYVRAIQAGCSQDDDCLSVFSMSGPQGSIKGGAAVVASFFVLFFFFTFISVIKFPLSQKNIELMFCTCGLLFQVDSSETLSDSDTEGKALTEVHSIGVQVEDEKRRARFKRSNSVTASVQADLDPEGFPGLSVAVPTQDKSLQFGCSFQRHSSEPESASQYTECHRTVHTQGQWAYREVGPCPDGSRKFKEVIKHHSSRAWTATPSLEGPRSLPDSGRASPCMRDGEFFLRLLQTEVERMEGWCQNMEREAEENELPEDALELIRSAVGSAQMLMSQKVQQFFRLCQQSIDPSAYPQPTSQDLASFWDLLQLNIEDVRVRFQDLQKLKDSDWRLPPEKKKLPPPLPKKPAGHTLPIREKSLDLGDRQRTEARRRLLQTKRTASFRQNSATESADSIEIYIPEAQTRL
uniref:Discs, large (Drosophila) homolog-associated protein 3 n=1 Tax=Poecilia reticulata TaxID=8081 RepID=A0A3P9Q4B2_POERE